jgi:3-hydroxyisobutyrate dehydrogenase
MSSKPTVAVLGAAGTMGRGIALNLTDAGFPLRAWDRSPEKAAPLAEKGATVLATPAEAAKDASVVITMLPDAEVVLDVAARDDGFLSGPGEDSIWVQMSTIGVDGTEGCAAAADRRGVTFVDAPVLGTKAPAEKGELIVLASGPDSARGTLEEIFSAIGKRTMWVGEAGAGSRLKVVINSWLVSVVEGAAETIALAEGADVDPHLFLDAIADGPLDMPYLQMKARAMIERSFEPSFKLSLAAKDARLAAELAERHDLDLPLLRTISDRLAAAVAEHGEEDLAATYLTSSPRA